MLWFFDRLLQDSLLQIIQINCIISFISLYVLLIKVMSSINSKEARVLSNIHSLIQSLLFLVPFQFHELELKTLVLKEHFLGLCDLLCLFLLFIQIWLVLWFFYSVLVLALFSRFYLLYLYSRD